MTVAAASDFQLRPAIFSERLSLLRLTKYRFGNPTCNLEHRRVKLPSLKRSGIDESRWLRVERKALVFFPTLNKRLSHFQRTIRAILHRGRFAIAREFSHALHSLPRLSVCDSGRDMSIDMRATFCLHRIFLQCLFRQRGQKIQLASNNGSVGIAKSLPDISSWVNSSEQSSQCRERPQEISQVRGNVARDPKRAHREIKRYFCNKDAA